MNYKLANQLKDAGFPNISFECISDIPHLVHYDNGEKCQWELQKAPTLSELIEACGIPSDRMNFQLETVFNELWVTEKSGLGFSHSAEGSSPEEAVAKLWLKLHA